MSFPALRFPSFVPPLRRFAVLVFFVLPCSRCGVLSPLHLLLRLRASLLLQSMLSVANVNLLLLDNIQFPRYGFSFAIYPDCICIVAKEMRGKPRISFAKMVLRSGNRKNV
jgi:hypothetical protein